MSVVLDKCTIRIYLKPNGTAVVFVEGDEDGFYFAGGFTKGFDLSIQPYDEKQILRDTTNLHVDDISTDNDIPSLWYRE